MNTVLKKAGIVVATAAAGLLAASPLALAGDYSGGHDHHGHHHHHGHHSKFHGCKLDNGVSNGKRNNQRGLVNIQNTNVQVPIQACNNSVIEGVLGILAKGQRNSDSH
jgi:hypothetical protein